MYLTQHDKFAAIIEDIRDCMKRGQPVLVGTTSIETSELLSGLLHKEVVPHQVLNAKQHEREAHIVAQAGRPGTITIATNMAGRGTDIVLGGNLEAELHALENPDEDTVAERQARVAGAPRRRSSPPADCTSSAPSATNRGASTTSCAAAPAGRAIPGSSRFYLSLEDNLMRIFGDPDRTKALLSRVGMKAGEVIESRMLTRQIERRSARSRRTTSTPARTCSSTTTSPTTSAR